LTKDEDADHSRVLVLLRTSPMRTLERGLSPSSSRFQLPKTTYSSRSKIPCRWLRQDRLLATQPSGQPRPRGRCGLRRRPHRSAWSKPRARSCKRCKRACICFVERLAGSMPSFKVTRINRSRCRSRPSHHPRSRVRVAPGPDRPAPSPTAHTRGWRGHPSAAGRRRRWGDAGLGGGDLLAAVDLALQPGMGDPLPRRPRVGRPRPALPAR
jgi:hypothetical protein